MPFLRDVAHDGWLGTYITTAGNSISSQLGSSCQGGWYGTRGKGRRCCPSITHKITPAGSLSSSRQGGQLCWASPLAFGLIGCHSFHGRQCSSLFVFTSFSHIPARFGILHCTIGQWQGYANQNRFHKKYTFTSFYLKTQFLWDCFFKDISTLRSS